MSTYADEGLVCSAPPDPYNPTAAASGLGFTILFVVVLALTWICQQSIWERSYSMDVITTLGFLLLSEAMIIGGSLGLSGHDAESVTVQGLYIALVTSGSILTLMFLFRMWKLYLDYVPEDDNYYANTYNNIAEWHNSSAVGRTSAGSVSVVSDQLSAPPAYSSAPPSYNFAFQPNPDGDDDDDDGRIGMAAAPHGSNPLPPEGDHFFSPPSYDEAVRNDKQEEDGQ